MLTNQTFRRSPPFTSFSDCEVVLRRGRRRTTLVIQILPRERTTDKQTTPKKIKHKRKKVKMAILKYYKVGSDGKIQRLRRECPAPTCGAGVFMAWHKDRQACGKCGLTYTFEEGTKPSVN